MRAVIVLALCLLAGCPARAPEAPRAPDGGAAREDERAEEVRLTEEAQRIAGIRVGRAERRALSGGASIPAEVEFDPTSTAHVAPLVPGRFTRIATTLGANVRRGDLLAVLASTDVSAARARLNQSRARLAAAQSALVRQRTLTTEGIGAQRALVEAEAQVADLRAEVAGLQQQLAVFGSGAGGEIRLTSPIDGVVVAMHATLGENAGTNGAAFEVTDPTRVWVRGNVPELDLARVAPNMAAVVRFHAFPDDTFPGRVTYVAPSLDDATRALQIRVSLDRLDARLRGGLFGGIELLGAPDERPLAVPVDAVATLDGRTVVFVPGREAGSFRPQAVEVGRRSGRHVEVLAGLTEGAALAVSGAFTLKSALKSEELEAEE
ncbi:MAG: efflux RND transporter periplasmic adaptor subunit [Polyangiales bacterium]